LGATFDPEKIHEMATDISIEARIKHAQDEREGHSNIFEGLDFWSPNINIFRDPRWGRGQETYGEDPFLTAHMGVAFVTGMQGDDPHYYRVISTPKHYAVHSGPESTRHKANVDVSKHDEMDTYLPAFRATITQAKAGSIMCAYNSINGQPACANEFLLEDQLRGKWGFKGYVVSDCDAVTDIFSGHHFTKSQPEASAVSLKRGMDNECADFFAKVNDDHDYKPYIEAVQQGFLKESDIDVALVRLFTARMKLGMFDPPSTVPYAKIDPHDLNSAAHRALARKLGDESMVLLKNDGTLPLKTSGIRIALIGPLASQTRFLLGNYTGIPTHTVSILEGMKAEFPNATIDYEEGTQFLSKRAEPVPANLLTTDGKPGVKASYSQASAMDIANPTKRPPVLATRVEPGIDPGAAPLPAEMEGKGRVLIRWDATLTAPETGDYNLGMAANGFFGLSLDGKPVTNGFQGNGEEAKMGRVHLEKGKTYTVEANYGQMQEEKPIAKLMWSKVDLAPQPAAIAAAKNADVIVAVVGITSELEGEEMQVHEEGFSGGDRTLISLPKPEEELLEALGVTGKPLVVVLANGSALAVNWAKEHANAILESWYAGEEGGTAIADTLSGRNNPGGKLPVTFYTGVDQLPPFEDYAMKGRTYRYFEGTPLYPFGYGLSYTTFTYSGLTIPKEAQADSLEVDVTVRNTGKVAGDEVAELYLTFPTVAGAPLRALRGFKRVHLDAGGSQRVRFELGPRDLSMVTEAGDPIIAKGEYTVTVGGGQPNTAAEVVTGKFRVNEEKKLPE
jgi:beta-glucosidase